ncbi:MAG: RNA-binding protein, partial [Deltaproteobacteria bacterium]|nr:RNA-binding protein [Deltaproteobacteria bacterium]
QGRAITVSEARPMKPRGEGMGGGGGFKKSFGGGRRPFGGGREGGSGGGGFSRGKRY